MLTDGDYFVRMVDFPGDIHGATRLDEEDFASVYINDWLSPMGRRRAFRHEIRHIVRGDHSSDDDIREVEK